MIKRERIADNVYSFQSDLYAQVNAGAVIGPTWAVVIDTLALPEESLAIRDFIEQEINIPVRYVINTHSHADHAWGNCFFPGATIIGHYLTREFLDTIGRQSLEEVRTQNLSFRNVRIVLPHVTYREGELNLRVGKKTLTMLPLPGHCADNIGVLIKEDRLMFAGDVAMPIPYIVDGNIDDMITSLKEIGKMGLESAVQGHGGIILRGEFEGYVKENISYLSSIRKFVRQASRRKYPQDLLNQIGVEQCGKSHVLLGGLAEELHSRNLRALYYQLYGEVPQASEIEEYY